MVGNGDHIYIFFLANVAIILILHNVEPSLSIYRHAAYPMRCRRLHLFSDVLSSANFYLRLLLINYRVSCKSWHGGV